MAENIDGKNNPAQTSARAKVKARLGFDPYEKYPNPIAGAGTIIDELKKCFDLAVMFDSGAHKIFLDFGYTKFEITQLFGVTVDNPRINAIIEVQTPYILHQHQMEVGKIMQLLALGGLLITPPKDHTDTNTTSFLVRPCHSDEEIKKQMGIIQRIIHAAQVHNLIRGKVDGNRDTGQPNSNPAQQ